MKIKNLILLCVCILLFAGCTSGVEQEKIQEKIIEVPAENQIKEVPVENQIKEVPVEDQIKEVPAENQIIEVPAENLRRFLESNFSTNIIIVSEIDWTGMKWSNDTVLIPSLGDELNFRYSENIEIAYLLPRLEFLNSSFLKVNFRLVDVKLAGDSKYLEYEIIDIEGLESVAEYKERLETEREKVVSELIAETERLETNEKFEEPKIEEELLNEKKMVQEALKKVKEYESQKRWCYALGEYYDVLAMDVHPEAKNEAYAGYLELKNSILAGNPGFGTFNEFTIYDEWKNLLIDAEKYGSTFNPYKVLIGNLERGVLDYETKTSSYTASITYRASDRYNFTIDVIQKGYEVAYKDDWKSLPKPSSWPRESVSSEKNEVYDVNGAFVLKSRYLDTYFFETITEYFNAFGVIYGNGLTYISCEYSIVDENGRELVKRIRNVLGESEKIEFIGVTPDIMDLIDRGKAYVKPVGCYLKYGDIYFQSNYGKSRLSEIIKKCPEVELEMEKSVFICDNNDVDEKALLVNRAIYQHINDDVDMIKIPNRNILMSRTEVTQKLYTSIMGANPNYLKGSNYPAGRVNWYDAIYFCNKLSELEGLTPVYSVDGRKSVSAWNYTPHQDWSIEGIINQDITANGYRLPAKDEWTYAAKGGDDYDFAGSDNYDDVGWFYGNASGEIQPVAQKEYNGYGLYDMSGNVYEWCWSDDSYQGVYIGGCANSSANSSYTPWFSNSESKSARYDLIGFRLVRTITEENTDN